MVAPTVAPEGLTSRTKRWFLAARIEQAEASESGESKQRQQPWWKLLCLTRVFEKAR
jgi:hypothetical protein